MFGEFLREHPLEGLVKELPRCPFPPAADREAWEGLDASVRESLLALAKCYRDVEYPVLTAGQYMAFAKTGDRRTFEEPYFLRRRKLIAALMGICLEGNQEDLAALIDGVWLLCEESTWVISAHNGGEYAGVEPTPPVPLPDVEKPYVDLFAAQTAMILSLTFALAGDALDAASPEIRRRVRSEIERRVLAPFGSRDDFWWMGFIRKDLCNWTPWIVSNVMLTACEWVKDVPRLCAILERGCGMLDRYLDCLPWDGGCDEGPGYWSMAGGALLDCLELMERVTGGRMAFWGDAKLQNVLRFPRNVWLGGDWFVNFADCDARPDIPGERLECAGKALGDPTLAAFGARFRDDPAGLIDDTPQLWRLLNAVFGITSLPLWGRWLARSAGRMRSPVAAYEAETQNKTAENLISLACGQPASPEGKPFGEAVPPEDVYLPDSQIFILRRDGMTLACKGGVNAGSHSHDDCGSFMVYVDGEPEIVDAGNMTYTGKTFSDQRHTLWNIRSANHNVPMIGGCEQASGREHRARNLRADASGIRMQLADAYPAEAGVLSCSREATLQSGRIRIRDVIQTREPASATEVLLLRHRPRIEGGVVMSGKIRIAVKPEAAVQVDEIPVDDPRMAKSFPGSLWRLSFTLPAKKEQEIRMTIERRD